MSTLEVVYPPSPDQVQSDLETFAAFVRKHYGRRLRALYLFGSRARGDHSPESDVDVAIVLDELTDKRAEKEIPGDLAYSFLVEHGVIIQPWPVSLECWNDPARHRNPSLIRNMKAEGIELGGIA